MPDVSGRAMNIPGVIAVAGWELRLAVRGRLVLGTAVTFTVVCVVATLLGLRSVSNLGLVGVGPGTGALIMLRARPKTQRLPPSDGENVVVDSGT